MKVVPREAIPAASPLAFLQQIQRGEGTEPIRALPLQHLCLQVRCRSTNSGSFLPPCGDGKVGVPSCLAKATKSQPLLPWGPGKTPCSQLFGGKHRTSCRPSPGTSRGQSHHRFPSSTSKGSLSSTIRGPRTFPSASSEAGIPSAALAHQILTVVHCQTLFSVPPM